jgi:hypothetical protein
MTSPPTESNPPAPSAARGALRFRCLNPSQLDQILEFEGRRSLLRFQPHNQDRAAFLGLILHGGQLAALRGLCGSLLVNGSPTDDCWLQRGDLIQCGDARLEFLGTESQPAELVSEGRDHPNHDASPANPARSINDGVAASPATPNAGAGAPIETTLFPGSVIGYGLTERPATMLAKCIL